MADHRWAAGKQQIIEGVIDQLEVIFALERHWTKYLQGLLARMADRIGLHLQAATQCPARSSGAPISEFVGLSSYASNVLGINKSRLGLGSVS